MQHIKKTLSQKNSTNDYGRSYTLCVQFLSLAFAVQGEDKTKLHEGVVHKQAGVGP